MKQYSGYKTTRPEDSVIVSDASMGWWTSGFAQRPTLSAVDPQYLILQREFEPASVASNLLKADYSVGQWASRDSARRSIR